MIGLLIAQFLITGHVCAGRSASLTRFLQSDAADRIIVRIATHLFSSNVSVESVRGLSLGEKQTIFKLVAPRREDASLLERVLDVVASEEAVVGLAENRKRKIGKILSISDPDTNPKESIVKLTRVKKTSNESDLGSVRTNLSNSGSKELHGADLPYKNMKNADFRGENLKGADFEAANLKGASMREADFRGANLRNADLVGTDMRNANLKGADMRNADLAETVWKGADLRGADLRGAKVKGADFRGAKYDNRTLFPVDFPYPLKETGGVL